MKHVLLGIRPHWAALILDGKKLAELRRGRRAWAPGDWLWIYATAPVQRVVGVALVNHVLSAPAAELERRRGVMALTEREFREVAGGAGLLTAAWLVRPVRLARPRTLKALGVAQPPRSAVTLPARALGLLTADAAVQARQPALDDLAALLARNAAR